MSKKMSKKKSAKIPRNLYNFYKNVYKMSTKKPRQQCTGNIYKNFYKKLSFNNEILDFNFKR